MQSSLSLCLYVYLSLSVSLWGQLASVEGSRLPVGRHAAAVAGCAGLRAAAAGAAAALPRAAAAALLRTHCTALPKYCRCRL